MRMYVCVHLVKTTICRIEIVHILSTRNEVPHGFVIFHAKQDTFFYVTRHIYIKQVRATRANYFLVIKIYTLSKIISKFA